MGTWGASLYEDDQASDLKNTVGILSKVPGDGDRLLGFLKEMYGACDPTDDDGAIFWLVTADQFERRGIKCAEVTSTALAIIESSSDQTQAHDKAADQAYLSKRSIVLQELAQRLRSPRQIRARPQPRKAPDFFLEEGEVYAFPTMKGRAWHPYRLPKDGPFEPDGWGALVILATGRAFDWIPWVALASLTVGPDSKPTLDDALKARLIPHLQTNGAGRYIPKRAHVQGLGLELLGRIALSHALVEPHLSKWGILAAIECDWSVAYGAIAPTAKGLPVGIDLASLLKQSG
jgi:hypothetical protein